MQLTVDELQMVSQILNREPSVVEKALFKTMCSEHCSYKSSKSILKKYLPTQGSDVVLGIGEDSGIIYFVHF